MTTALKSHWETIYANKRPDEVSWTQEAPTHSLELIRELSLPKTASIIDIGGGDSKLVDYLLDEGYEDITVLDISANAIERAKERLGEARAQQVNWIVSDILTFEPDRYYDLWHDRATFHFLTEEASIQQYVTIAEQAVRQYLIMGTFSDQGPEKCSGLSISQYDENGMKALFSEQFANIRCDRYLHETPFETKQEFLFCSFQRR